MKEKTPILLMLYSLHDGGTEHQVTEIARSLDRSEFEPHVAAVHFAQPLLGELQQAGVPMLTLPLTSFLSASFGRTLAVLRRHIRQHEIRIVHTFDPTTTILATAARFVAPIPCLLSSQRAYRDLTFQRYRRLLRVSDRLVDGIVVNCEAMRRHLVEDEGARESLISVCYNSIDTERFRPLEQPKTGRLTIGTACVFRKEKDLGCLLRAFASLRDDYPHADLAMVGDGPEKPGLMQLAVDLGLGERCRFAGYQARLEGYLPEIDIFVLPSVSEALSNSLMEAMACGCGVVATRVGGAPEIVRPNDTGMLFEPGDAGELSARLRQLIEDPVLLSRIRRAAARYIRQEFSRATVIARWHEIYRASLNHTNRRN